MKPDKFHLPSLGVKSMLYRHRSKERFDEAPNRDRRAGRDGPSSAVLLGTRLALDIQIHDVYWAVSLNIIGFWFLIGSACFWFLIVAWTSIRRHF